MGSREETRDDIADGVGKSSITIKSMWCTYNGKD